MQWVDYYDEGYDEETFKSYLALNCHLNEHEIRPHLVLPVAPSDIERQNWTAYAEYLRPKDEEVKNFGILLYLFRSYGWRAWPLIKEGKVKHLVLNCKLWERSRYLMAQHLILPTM
jgi:hypothetical protein